ncbi:MAG TPA: AgmX/PglI C-terminal domain-containing protein [Kofleriaceae bacterium]|nr:AgmX/PglI C-terminal domain-containing protein [Kofleriaceae bacterium]
MRPAAVALAAAFCLSAAGTAAAEPCVSEGGPAGAARKRLIAALAAIDLGVCFRDATGPVHVAIEVAADGRVTRSTQRDGGAPGQCAAGILAVSRLPADGTYRAVVAVDGKTGAARTQDSIDADLAELRPELDACQARDPKKGGEVSLAFLIKADGTLADAKVSSSTLASPAIEKCLLAVLAGASLSARPGAKAVAYTLSIGFNPGAAGGGTPAGGALVPQKEGPLDGALIQKAIRARQGDLDACYRKQAARNPKLAGVVTIRFSVYADGKTYNAAVKDSTLHDAAVEACVVKVFAGLRFPAEPTREKTRVFYPLRFGAP